MQENHTTTRNNEGQECSVQVPEMLVKSFKCTRQDMTEVLNVPSSVEGHAEPLTFGRLAGG